MDTIVFLGNPNPQHLHAGESTRRKADHLSSPTVTVVELGEDYDRATVKAALSVCNTRHARLIHQRARALSDAHKHYALHMHDIEELWDVHAAGAKPTFVSVVTIDPKGKQEPKVDATFQKVLAGYYGCPEGEITVEDGRVMAGPTMLISNGGRDALHQQHLSTSAQPAAFTFGALTTNTGGGFATTDTTLASELTTNGLARAGMTFAHTTGTNTSTLTHTWTYTGTGAVVIASFGNFNAASAGTLGEEDALGSSITVATSGDTGTVTFTFTA